MIKKDEQEHNTDSKESYKIVSVTKILLSAKIPRKANTAYIINPSWRNVPKIYLIAAFPTDFIDLKSGVFSDAFD